MNTNQSSTRYEPTATEVDMCLGLVASQLFKPEQQLVGQPSVAEFFASPSMRHSDIKDLAVESLEWMTLLTKLENQLDIEFSDDLMINEKLTLQCVARAVAESLLRQRSNSRLIDPPVHRQATFSGKQYRVIDNFLPPKVLHDIRINMGSTDFQRVDSVVDAKVDGMAYRSRGQLLNFDAAIKSGNPDNAYHSILRTINNCVEVYGKAGEDWSTLSFAYCKYPAGSRLGWHNDAGKGRTGEFILYLHNEWQPSWSGELLLLDRDTNDKSTDNTETNPFKRIETEVACADTELVAIQPRPNRLVLVKAGTPHTINRVDVAAGEVQRCTLTGFAAKREVEQEERQAKLNKLESLLGGSLEKAI
jgi:Rps23 Pro-64 3,4-dihydroxylase Tpa1-like proline 4-hydroxylase